MDIKSTKNSEEKAFACKGTKYGKKDECIWVGENSYTCSETHNITRKRFIPEWKYGYIPWKVFRGGALMS